MSSEPFLDHFHHDRGIALLRFGDQKVEVFRHDDVTVDDKLILTTSLFKDFEKQVAVLRTAEFGPALVTTAGDEVQVLGAVISYESGGH